MIAESRWNEIMQSGTIYLDERREMTAEQAAELQALWDRRVEALRSGAAAESEARDAPARHDQAVTPRNPAPEPPPRPAGPPPKPEMTAGEMKAELDRLESRARDRQAQEAREQGRRYGLASNGASNRSDSADRAEPATVPDPRESARAYALAMNGH